MKWVWISKLAENKAQKKIQKKRQIYTKNNEKINKQSSWQVPKTLFCTNECKLHVEFRTIKYEWDKLFIKISPFNECFSTRTLSSKGTPVEYDSSEEISMGGGPICKHVSGLLSLNKFCNVFTSGYERVEEGKWRSTDVQFEVETFVNWHSVEFVIRSFTKEYAKRAV